jgi:hypothetical protein
VTYDEKGCDRLTLRFLRDRDAKFAWNFDALVWEIQAGIEWNQVSAFSREEVAATSSCRRWIADVASFDAGRGRAIIKIGQESEPDLQGRVWAKYSWWDCDMAGNRLLHLRRDCLNPSETFDEEREG